MFQSPCYALGVLLSWTNWNSSYLWGNAFVFSLWEKGRHSLQSRIRQKSSVEVLCCRTPLKGAESSAHCCGFFSVTSDKDFFFLWEAGPAAPEPMQVGEMRCLQLQGKKTKQKTKNNLVFMYWKGNTSCNRQNEVWCFVVSDKQCRTVYCPHPTFTAVVWNQLLSAIGTSHGKLWQAEGKAPAGVLSMIILPCQRKHLFSILITSLRRFKLLVNTLKDGTDAKAEEQTSPRAESYHAGKGQRYSISLLSFPSPF